MNAKGDWWKMVQKVLKTALPVGAAVSTAFGQPEVGALLMAGDALVNMPSMKDNKKQNPANKMRKEARAQKKK
jgi:GTP cyclohydrolase III